MRAELYKTLKGLLLAGQEPRLESSLAVPGQERLSWDGGSLGELPEGPVFAQTLTAPARLVICGGGHVARALTPAAKAVGFAVTVLDDRPELLDPDLFPLGTDLRSGSFEALMEGDFGPNPFFAIMTRGHLGDWVCLERILNRPHAYVGMMGSRKKAAATRQRLAEQGVDSAVIDSVHTPIGLDIGAETPAEIAVSIVAELIRCRKALGLEAPLDVGLIDALDQPPYALVTLVDCQGSTPREPGARMLVISDGSLRGTIGGGISETAAVTQALQALERNEAVIGTYRLDGSAGSICGGAVRYLIIPVKERDFPC